jgi:drug/metabolite transporter (DMT)-like permease
VVAAFAAVYVIWGSTYLAIRFAIETIPPFLMAGARFLIAGGVLYGWLRARGVERPTRVNWVAATVVGGLLLLGGNGAVVWAEQRVPSGIASLLAATVPLWMVLLDWIGPKGTRPGAWVSAGIALGLAGIVLLVGPGTFAGGAPIDHVGAAALVLGSLAWAAGSLYARRGRLPASPLLGTAMQMLAGGALLVVTALFTGELGAVSTATISLKSAGALLYLVIFGSLIGFTCYIWLLRVSTPARVSTYASVTPVVAVVLGWAFAGEPLTMRTLIAAAVIVGAVALITVGQRGGPEAPGPRFRERVTGRLRTRGIPVAR